MTYDLLPGHSTPLEKAFDRAGGERLDLPLALSDLYRPWHVPPVLLPYAAFGLSTDLWDRDWTEEQKRHALSRSIAWHRLKGTAAALIEAIEAFDGDVRELIVPPSKTYLMPSLTDDEKLAYLSRFAQIRIYPFVERDLSGFYHFTSAAFGLPKAHLGDGFFTITGARQRYRREAFLWDRGEVTPLTTRAMTEFAFDGQSLEFDEVVLPTNRVKIVAFGGATTAPRFLAAKRTAGRRMLRVPRGLSYTYEVAREAYVTTLPDADLISIEPERVYENHPGQAGAVYPGAGAANVWGYVPPSIAWRHVYQRLYLHDPDRAPDKRTRALHLGTTRLTMPSFNAEVRVRTVKPEPSQRVRRFVRGFFAASNPAERDGLFKAARAALSQRDRVLLTTKTYRTIQAGDRLLPGDAKAGQMTEV